MEERVTSLDKHITKLQREQSEVEWCGDFEHADFLKKLIDSSIKERNKGEVYYVKF